MEAEAQSKPSGDWSCATNWSVADGTLVNTITVESSLFPIADPPPKSPFILNPPSSDSGPCEIKITFTQKHEVRQVYVRSTARVYEIYYAPNLQSINEYLCTVRCSIAAKDEKSLHVTDVEESVSAHSEGSNGELAGENLKNGSSVGSNEDGWVEVKAPDSHSPDNRSSLLSSKLNINTERISQDFYEATAEITDGDPCISLTLRLLSLQNKECVYIDEIYVFADPVDSDSLDSQAGSVENPAGSSLMAMLVPTLLQLSKTGINQKHDKVAADIREEQKFSKIGSTATDLTNIANKIQLEGKSCLSNQQEGNQATAEQAPVSIKLLPDAESQPASVAGEDNLLDNQLEKTMEILVSRVGRIESLCSRFEENMLKPISSIEARLQRVEQQLEILTKKFEGSGVISSTRIFAPEFPCNGSDSNSFCNDASDYPSRSGLECEKLDIPSDKLPMSPDESSVPINATQMLPSLVIIAPEFSNGDEEDANDELESVKDSPRGEFWENDASEPVKDSPGHKPWRMSVDDAVASALSGFLSSSTNPSKYTETLTVRAPEFPSEDDSSEDKIVSPRVQYENFSESNRNENNGVKDSASTLCDISSLESEGIEKRDQLDHEVAVNFNESGVVALRTDDYQTVKGTDKTEATNSSVPDGIYIPIHFLGDEINDFSDITQNGTSQEGSDETPDPSAAPETTDGKPDDILKDVLQFSCSASAVDFQVPILDVKFISQENCSSKSLLEALLTEASEPNKSDLETPVEETQDGKHNPVPGEDGETKTIIPAIDNNLLPDFESYSVEDAESGMEDSHKCNKEVSFESLI